MSLQHNLLLAELAVKYTQEKMLKGASNKPEDLAHSSMRHASQNFVMRALTQPDLNTSSVTEQRKAMSGMLEDKDLTDHERVLLAGETIEASGLGNCGEQSSLAYRWLYHRKDADLFVLAKLGKNHEFIIIGASSDQVKGCHAVSAAPNWPADAVICDPWYYEWFAVASSWTAKVRQILNRTEPGWVHVRVDVKPVSMMAWNRVH
jgi:hypothetical protein